MERFKWQILKKIKSKKVKNDDIIDILLENRGLRKKERDEFFSPKHPEDLSIKYLEIDLKEVNKAIKRIKKAIECEEEILIYGDYDADGICATAILWECLYYFTPNVFPYIPSRFEEGYGLNIKSIKNLKRGYKNLKLIITVDNGIVAKKQVDEAKKLDIDVIISDHHLKGKELPKAVSIIHTTKVSGSALVWILSREILKKFKNFASRKKAGNNRKKFNLKNNLELAAIGTISDQMPLLGINRSFAKYGLEELNRTERVGLLALFEEAMIKPGNIGVYEVNFIIAPRINAMGRLEHAIDSLRLLCTTNLQRAKELANVLGKTNRERQRILDEVVVHAKEFISTKDTRTIVISHESYHEGVIGLAASKLVEEFYKPAIVVSKKKLISKASARSIPGFNIIEAIRKVEDLILEGGGHPMAAGFSIRTDKIEIFKKRFEEISGSLLSDDLMTRKLRIDCEVEFENLNLELAQKLRDFEPTGVGNPLALFATRGVRIIDADLLGMEGKHLRLKLEKNGKVFEAIAFGKGEIFQKISPDHMVDISYSLEIDTFNNEKKLRLKIKDIKI